MEQTGSREMAVLAERLAERREEIEQTILARVYAVDDPTEVGDPEYVLGLKTAVSVAVSYGLSAIDTPQGFDLPVPDELLSQARGAARSGVGLDTVLRRYVAGHALLADCFLQEAEGDDQLRSAPLQRVLRAEAVLFDRLVAAVADAYNDETKAQVHTSEHRRLKRVKRLLNGDFVDPPELRYELDAWHLGIVAVGPGISDAIRELAASLDRRPLLVRPGGGVTWAWLGGGQGLPASEALRLAKAQEGDGASLALGEPGWGITGWRLTHRQAREAMLALRGASGAVCYGDVALLAAALRDDVLAESLRQAYLAPLEDGRDEGRALRQTLRAYLAAGRNVSSAAAALGVSRQTVKKRVCIAEEKIGQPLAARAAEIETALRLSARNPTEPDSVANLQPG